MADLGKRAAAATASLDGVLANSAGRTALLRALSTVNARWVNRLAAQGAGTKQFERVAAESPELELGYLAAIQQALRGEGVR